MAVFKEVWTFPAALHSDLKISFWTFSVVPVLKIVSIPTLWLRVI